MPPERGYEALAVEGREDGVLVVRLNRPDQLNAFDAGMKRDFWKLAERIESDDVRVVVVTGEGRGFCAGADLSWFEDGPVDRAFRYEYARIHDFFDELERCEKPVIAAINGICAGGGVELAAACDLRIASDKASFVLPEHNIGLIPASGGCSRLPRLIGLSWAKYFLLTGERLPAERARELGLVHEVVTPDRLVPRALELAGDLAGRAPLALGMAKQVMNLAAGVDPHTGRFIERLGQSVLVKSRDHREGIAAFRAKRRPEFEGR